MESSHFVARNESGHATRRPICMGAPSTDAATPGVSFDCQAKCSTLDQKSAQLVAYLGN